MEVESQGMQGIKQINAEAGSSEPRTLRSYSLGDLNEVTIHDFSTNYSVTAALNYCKVKILKPYMRLLKVVGLRPLSVENSQFCSPFLSYFYTILVVIFMVCGYILQYMACFRRDRGFGYKTILKHPNTDENEPDFIVEQICRGSLVYSFIIPDSLHLFGYLFAVTSFRCSDDDKLASLMERVFSSLSNLRDGFTIQKRLVKTFWILVGISLFWMSLSFVSVNIMMYAGSIQFKWLEEAPFSIIVFFKVLLTIFTLWHDVIQASVISNYCLQAQLLTTYSHFLRAKLLQQSLQPTDWMRDVEEFKQLLKYFNKFLAPAVCIFTIINIACAVSGLFWLMHFDTVDTETEAIFGISLLNVFLWFIIALAPFIQAARVTAACKNIRDVGHEVRTRPFVHQSTPDCKLDSILLYACSLKLSAKLYSTPISGRIIWAVLAIFLIIALITGQLHYINAQYLNLPY